MIQLISFEGCDGTGKTTQMKLLEAYLTARDTTFVSTREPGGTTLGKMIRRVLSEGVEEGIGCETELFLYLADRAQHVREIIRPAIQSGVLVLCDRFTDSTLAYQGYGRGINLAWLRRVNRLASGGIHPDLTLLLDCPVEVSMSRTARRLARRVSGEKKDRLDAEGLRFHNRVRTGFLELARAEPGRFAVIDATAPPPQVHEEIKRIVNARLANGE